MKIILSDEWDALELYDELKEYEEESFDPDRYNYATGLSALFG